MKKHIGLMALALTLAAGTAQAGTFVWKDKTDGFTFSFPDSWTVQTPDVPSTVVRIAGPIGEDRATCRVRATPDGRLKIYPKRLMTKAVEETLNLDFWGNETAQYEGAGITGYYAPASMGGQGDATAVRVSFIDDGAGGRANMHGAMIGSIYGDTRYVVSCSSKLEEYQKYAPVFTSIMGSVALDARYHPFETGYYRNFLADPQLMLPRTKPGTVSR